MKSKLLLRLGATLAIACVWTLAGCAGMMASRGQTSLPPSLAACVVFEPIYWANGDTDETIKAVKLHNAAWLKLCGKPQKDQPK